MEHKKLKFFSHISRLHNGFIFVPSFRGPPCGPGPRAPKLLEMALTPWLKFFTLFHGTTLLSDHTSLQLASFGNIKDPNFCSIDFFFLFFVISVHHMILHTRVISMFSKQFLNCFNPDTLIICIFLI